jgi:phage FluMu gp28-like protein
MPRSAKISQSKPVHTVHAVHNVHVPTSPRDLLLPYQRAWADDTARFKLGCMARQTGKDFSSAEEGIRDCYEHDLRGDKTSWLIGAAGERQALESLEKWKEWTEAYKLAIADYQEIREGGSETLLKSAQITFPHGSRVLSVPANPNTVRGFSANILLTEFAFIENPDATWRAIVPSITNPLRGGQKKIRLISTPNGIGNKFHDLYQKNYQVPDAKWSVHRVTIHDAVAAGLPIDIEELRAALDDPEGWAQEFECEFMDVASILLSYELIIPCENPLATETLPPEFWAVSPRNAEPIDIGLDFGRKKDLTVAWSLALIAGAFQLTREVHCLSKMSTDNQVDNLRPRIRRSRRTCLDYTGPGIGLGDYLVKEFGEYNPEKHLYGKIELCTFTNAFKCEIFSKLRMAFDQKRIGIPTNRVIREDLHSMHRITTPGGQVTYRAPHTPDGHADRCTALALGVRAGTGNTVFAYESLTPPRQSISTRERCVLV